MRPCTGGTRTARRSPASPPTSAARQAPSTPAPQARRRVAALHSPHHTPVPAGMHAAGAGRHAAAMPSDYRQHHARRIRRMDAG